MSKIKNGGLDQYGTEPFEQQQFGTAGGEKVISQRAADRPERLGSHVTASVHSHIPIYAKLHSVVFNFKKPSLDDIKRHYFKMQSVVADCSEHRRTLLSV